MGIDVAGNYKQTYMDHINYIVFILHCVGRDISRQHAQLHNTINILMPVIAMDNLINVRVYV